MGKNGLSAHRGLTPMSSGPWCPWCLNPASQQQRSKHQDHQGFHQEHQGSRLISAKPRRAEHPIFPAGKNASQPIAKFENPSICCTDSTSALLEKLFLVRHPPKPSDTPPIASARRAVVRCSATRGRCVSSVDLRARGREGFLSWQLPRKLSPCVCGVQRPPSGGDFEACS